MAKNQSFKSSVSTHNPGVALRTVEVRTPSGAHVAIVQQETPESRRLQMKAAAKAAKKAKKKS
jgi:hypothetical protein